MEIFATLRFCRGRYEVHLAGRCAEPVGISAAAGPLFWIHPRNLSWTGDFERFKAGMGQGYKVEIKPSGVRALEELIALCRERGVRVLLVYSPEYFEAQNFTLNRHEIIDEFQTIAARFHVQFWDYSDSPISHDRNLFYNSQHMNWSGAEAFSKDLADRLISTMKSSEPGATSPDDR